MEAAMRTAYKLVTDKEPPPYALTHLEDVRGMNGVKEATVQLGDDVDIVRCCCTRWQKYT